MKKKKIIIITLFVFLFVCGGLFTAFKLFFDPYRGTVSAGEWELTSALDEVLTKNQAVSEIDFILKRLEERHPACMDGIPQLVLEQTRIEKENMSEQVTVLQLWQMSSRILAKMSDGHTSVEPLLKQGNNLPISFRFDKEKLYVINGEFDGYEVTHIGGISTDELYRTFLSQFSYELEEYASTHFANLCQSSNYLAFLNIDVSGSVQIDFETPNGKVSQEFEFGLKEVEFERDDTPFVSYEIDKEQDVGIFILNKCTFDETYRKTLEAFFKEIKETQISNVIIDLRNNGGGSSNVINEFVRYLDLDEYFAYGGEDGRYGSILWKNKAIKITNSKIQDLLFKGDLYVLTSSLTFSSAMNFAVMISDNGLGQIVGEICGGMPSAYGDVLYFQTPITKMALYISFKRFYRVDRSKSDEPLIPDEMVSASEALNKVYEMVNQ